jgi:uncharacterized protein DUF5661
MATERRRSFSAERACDIGQRIGIDWGSSRFELEQFRMELVELQHGRRDPSTNVSDDDETITGKIACAHLDEFPGYYTRLAEMEAEAEHYWAQRVKASGAQPSGAPLRGHPARRGSR